MELSNEDSLRLNILLCQNVKAIRISESDMILYALLLDADADADPDSDVVKDIQEKEVSIKLNPNCKSDRYIKSVKEFLSSYFLNSPAGYPVYINRWTRMGQVKNEKAGELLKIGEPEAIIAIIFSDSISVEHARYAWWAYPSVESARQLLNHDNVANSDLAKELAIFLLEFLPFEIEAKDIILTVKLLLERGLMDENSKKRLWSKGRRKAAYLIGFLCCDPSCFPEDELSLVAEENDNKNEKREVRLNELKIDAVYEFPHQSSEGKRYIFACLNALESYSDQDSIVLLYDAIKNYFAPYETILEAHEFQYGEYILAIKPVILALSKTNHEDLTPVLAQSNAVGSLLRRKLKPVTEKLKVNLQFLIS